MTSPRPAERAPIQMYEDPEDAIVCWSHPYSNYEYERHPDIPNYWVAIRMKSEEEMTAEKVAQIKSEARIKAATVGDERRTALYRLRNADGDLLYVGVSVNPLNRWTQHAADKSWWSEVANMSIEWCDSTTEALAMEAHAIKTERPIHNVVHNNRPQEV